MLKAIYFLPLLFIVSLTTGCEEDDTSGVAFCTQDAKICPDGTALSRSEPNCAFPACPGEKSGEE